MKILVVGKKGSIVYWMENAIAGSQARGDEAYAFSIHGTGPVDYAHIKYYRHFQKRAVGEVVARKLTKLLSRLAPQLVLFVGAFWLPVELFHAVRQTPGRPLMAGWVGDRFTADDRAMAELLDRIYFTDSSFLLDARNFRFPDNGAYLPLAANPAMFRPLHLPRSNQMVFVANRTPHRQDVVSAILRPVTVFGRGWKAMKNHSVHRIHARRVPIQRVPHLYNQFRAVLNIRNEGNVTDGLNQRSFEPLACKTPVINDWVRDLERCFEPGREILVYRTVGELNELYGRVGDDLGFARKVADAGYRRVVAEHTYSARMTTIARDLGLLGA